MAIYTKNMHTLQIRMDAGKNPETGKSVIVSKTFDNIDMNLKPELEADNTALYEFGELVCGICGLDLLEVMVHQHGTLSF